MSARGDSYEMDIREIMRVRKISRSEAEEFYKRAYLKWMLDNIAKGHTLIRLTPEEELQITSGQGSELLKKIADDPRRDEFAKLLAKAKIELDFKKDN